MSKSTVVATLIAITAAIGTVVSIGQASPERWVHLAINIATLAMLGVLFGLVRQNLAGTNALARANDILAEAVARAQEAQSRAEAEAQQKARLAALLDAAL